MDEKLAIEKLVITVTYLFVDLQVIFYGQMTLVVCHWWAGIFANKFGHFG